MGDQSTGLPTGYLYSLFAVKLLFVPGWLYGKVSDRYPVTVPEHLQAPTSSAAGNEQ